MYFVHQGLKIKIISTVSAEQNTHIMASESVTDREKRSFEWSSNWTIKETSSRTGLDCSENVPNWTVKETFSRTGRLNGVGTKKTDYSRLHQTHESILYTYYRFFLGLGSLCITNLQGIAQDGVC